MEPITDGQRRRLVKLCVPAELIPASKDEAKELIWRLEPPSDAQLRRLREFEVPDDQMPKNRADAKAAIDTLSRRTPRDLREKLVEAGVAPEDVPEDKYEAYALHGRLGGPITDRQREYLVNLGVQLDEIPKSKGEASALIDKITSRATEKQLAVLRKFVSEDELPTTKEGAGTMLDFVFFIAATVRTCLGSSRAISEDDSRAIFRSLWDEYGSAFSKETETAEDLERLQEELDDADAMDEPVARLEALRKKVETAGRRAEKAEERVYKIEEWLSEMEERDDGKGVVPSDSYLARRVLKLLRERGIDVPDRIPDYLDEELADRAESRTASKSGCLLVIGGVAALGVYLAL